MMNNSTITSLLCLLMAAGAVHGFGAPGVKMTKPLATASYGRRILNHALKAHEGDESLMESEADYEDSFMGGADSTTFQNDTLCVEFGSSADLADPIMENISEQYLTSLDSSTIPDGEDVAKEIVLNVLNNSSPELIESEVTALVDTPTTAASITTEFLKAGTTDDEDDVVTKAEAVEALLQVSQQAADAAEASVSESIPLIPAAQQDYIVEDMGQVSEIIAAEQVVGKQVTKKEFAFDYFSVKRIVTFAVSATGVFLCSPLLSLIDTSAVGLLSGTAQQAALNPAVAVTDYAALLIAFLYTGATNLVAAAQEKDAGIEDKPKTTASFTTALQLSSYVGTGLGAILFVFARPLLKTLIGNDAINPAVFAAAMKYVRIRALGMPAAAIIGSAQASCLGLQDVKSPLYVLFAAALVNFFGDAFFVGMKNPWIGGAAGAAWATVISQYAATALFMKWLCFRSKNQEPKKVINLTNQIMELTGDNNSKGKTRRRELKHAIKSFAATTPGYRQGKSLANKVATSIRNKSTSLFGKGEDSTAKADTKKQEPSFSTRGFLAGKFRGRDLVKFPSRKNAKEFTQFVVPVTTTQIGRVSAYIAMSHVVSSTLGTAAMAAQQVIVSLFYCLTPIADSLSLTAQSIVPTLAEKRPSKARAKAIQGSMINLFKAGGIFGAAMVSAVAMIPFLGQFFTSDPGVIALVNSVAPLLIGFFGVHGLCMSCEGLLLGQKDLKFIGSSYGAFFFAVPYFMLRVKRAALAGTPGINLTSVWSIFVLYQLARVGIFMARTLQLQRKSNRDGAEADSALMM